MKFMIIGSSGHAKVVIDAIQKRGEDSIIGLWDDFRPIGETTMNIPVIGNVADIFTSNCEDYEWVIAIGDNKGRNAVYNKLRELRLNYPAVVHPSAIIAHDVTIGEGTFIAAGAIVNAGTSIGDHCIINTGAQLDHDNAIHDFVNIAPKVALAGNVTIERGSVIGIGSSVIEKIHIARQSVIGAGSVVTRNIARFKVAYGTPCKEQRDRTKEETFL